MIASRPVNSSDDADLPAWVKETHRAMEEVRKVFEEGPRVDISRLRRVVQRFLRTHRRFQKMADLFRARASQEGEGGEAELPVKIRESERLSREQDYNLSGWLEDLSEFLESRIETDRELARSLPAFLEEARALPKNSRFHSPRFAPFWTWLREATPEQVRDLQEAFRRDVSETEKALREFRRAAERITERSVKRAAHRRRKKK